ncbi:FecR family protein [Rhizosphaericola mali]|uniref:FecR family protein n=1 Tax=Rhizosphaericola mali TaxID=2545455 RepID=A0A5P2G9B4_9BACT|nr:FecR family protein [Rhizosphaericola mali]QES88111.1 FecR family protein [Rhizosphaericola mali]
MDENKFLKLLYKKLSHTADQEELRQLELLRNSQEEFNNLYNFFICENESLVENDIKESELAYAALFTKMHANGNFDGEESMVSDSSQLIPTNNKAKKIRLFVTSAAAAILVCFLIYGWYSNNNMNNTEWKNSNVVTTKKGSKSFILLPDGTKVWLNVDSKLTYQENFTGATRQVKLLGEAFFDVAKDAKHPFIIHTQDANIKVLGTAFNVKSYADDSSMETLLVRGKIEVSLKSTNKKNIILLPGDRLKIFHKILVDNNEKVKLDMTNDSVIIEKFNLGQKKAIQDTLWLENTIAFDSEPLITIAKKLEKWYGVTLVIKNEKLNTVKFTGKFENQPISFVLETLKETGKLSYELHKDTINLY